MPDITDSDLRSTDFSVKGTGYIAQAVVSCAKKLKDTEDKRVA